MLENGGDTKSVSHQDQNDSRQPDPKCRTQLGWVRWRRGGVDNECTTSGAKSDDGEDPSDAGEQGGEKLRATSD